MSYNLEDLKIDLLSNYKVSDFIEISELLTIIETKQQNNIHLPYLTKHELIKAFKSEVIKDLNQKKNFKNTLIKFNFQLIKRGTSRKIYHNKEYNLIIKESFNSKGIIQNNREIELSNDYYANTLNLNICLDYLETNSVYITFYDYCKPITKKEFKEKYKFSFKDFSKVLEKKYHDNINFKSLCSDYYKSDLLDLYCNDINFESEHGDLSDLLRCNNNLIVEYNLCDIFSLSQYGLNDKNQLVLLDYGLTYQDFKELYFKKKYS